MTLENVYEELDIVCRLISREDFLSKLIAGQKLERIRQWRKLNPGVVELPIGFEGWEH